jgi:hypothetical protein
VVLVDVVVAQSGHTIDWVEYVDRKVHLISRRRKRCWSRPPELLLSRRKPGHAFGRASHLRIVTQSADDEAK